MAPPLSTGALAADTCPASGIASSSSAINLTSNCQVAGNIILSGTASLTMTAAVLTVKRHHCAERSSSADGHERGLTFPQTSFGQYTVQLNNSAKMKLTNSTFVTTGILNNHFTVALDAHNTSIVDIGCSTLSTMGGSWLLGNFHDQSQLIVDRPKFIRRTLLKFQCRTQLMPLSISLLFRGAVARASARCARKF